MPTLEDLRRMQEAAALSSVAVPSPFGDAIGLGSDLFGMAVDPSQRTWGNAGLAALGVLPGVPSAAAAKAVAKKLPKLDALFDAKKGIGAVPNNEEVASLGRTVYMKPSEFLDLSAELTRPSQKSLDFISEGLSKGEKLGQPRLTIDLAEDGVPFVMNHDGRHRMMVVKRMFGDDVEVPVHVFGRGEMKEVVKEGKFTKSALRSEREQLAKDADEDLQALIRKADELRNIRRDR